MSKLPPPPFTPKVNKRPGRPPKPKPVAHDIPAGDWATEASALMVAWLNKCDKPPSVSELENAIQRIRHALSSPRQFAPISSVDNLPLPIKPPAVPIDQSVTPGYLICLEDGRHMRTLKRYLLSTYGLTPTQYRVRWGLPHDYPMTCTEVTDQKRRVAAMHGFRRHV